MGLGAMFACHRLLMDNQLKTFEEKLGNLRQQLWRIASCKEISSLSCSWNVCIWDADSVTKQHSSTYVQFAGMKQQGQESWYCTTYGKTTRVSLSLTLMLTNMWVIHMSQTVPFDGFHLWFRVWVVVITSMAAQSPEKTFTVRVLIAISMIRKVKSKEQLLMRRLSRLPSITQTPCTISLTTLFTVMLWFLVH